MVSADTIMDAAFGSIMVPKMLAIKNFRLGLLFRILQIAALFWVIYNTFALKAWNIVTIPLPDTFELWLKPPAPDTSGASTSTGTHCTDASSYNYIYSATYSYNYSRCVDPPSGEAFDKLGKTVFVPTTFQDTMVWQASGAADCTTLQALCPGKLGVFASTAAGCTCKRSDRVFVSRPEEVALHFDHGYVVSFPTGHKERGRDKSFAEVAGGLRGSWEEKEGKDGEMATIIIRTDGTRCPVGAHMPGGAKSLWTKEDVADDGIGGLFGEWMDCAGVKLDDTAPELSSGNPGEVGVPKLRMTGMEVNLELSYHNAADEGHDIEGYGAVCYITVSVNPAWNSATKVAYSEIPDLDTGAGSFRERHMYGISVNVQTKGSFARFDYNSLISIIVNAVVLLALPGTIVRLLALNGLGLLSKIYKRAQAQVVDIGSQFTGVAARIVSSVAVFQVLHGSGDDALEKQGLTPDQIRDRLRAAFSKEMESGVLSEDEFKVLADAAIRDLDASKCSKVSLSDFLAATASQESVEPKDMVSFFDRDRKRGLLEIAFTDSRLQRSVGVRSDKVQPVED
mmetsp:Transcript_29893/g.86920  ORF Transcript_29893/g.86920 Transcript_29893/m.86920 type:complete len:566 (-) Transcript_29893:242-1939(-)